MPDRTKVYVTKWALSRGIYHIEAEHYGGDSKYIKWFQAGTNYAIGWAHKPDWHLTLEEAKVYVEEIRVKRIQSLRRQIEKLEKMEIKVREA